MSGLSLFPSVRTGRQRRRRKRKLHGRTLMVAGKIWAQKESHLIF